METFELLPYERPNFEKMTEQILLLNTAMQNAANYDEFKKAYREIEKIAAHDRTIQTICSIRNTVNTADQFYEQEMKYISENSTNFQMAMLEVYKTLITSSYRPDFDKEFGDFLTTKLEYSFKLSNREVLQLGVKESALMQKYAKDSAVCTTEFMGEQCNFYGLMKHMTSIDRMERKAAFEAWADMYQQISGQLDDTYDQMVPLRVEMAKAAGFDNYIDYIYLKRNRFDYTSKDIEQFRKNVQEIIVPVCAKLYEIQRQRLGIEKLHYYDESLTFPEGNATPIGSKDELVEKARRMYNEMSTETGEYFNFMVEHQMFDLESKIGKRQGGYCTFLPDYKAPFIFSNFNGTSADVDVLTHEAGHAFQAYTGSRCIQTMMSISSTSEINEIHSMSMEHFAYPWMESFFGENADKYRYTHLVKALESIPYLVSVDEFQHRVFENPSMNAMERRAAWKKIEEKYLPWRDYDGNEFLEQGGFWMQKQHIFLYPFYYVDYALAQVCAFQFFIRSLSDRQQAWNDYLTLCKEGGTIGYFNLLKSVNLKNPFERETLVDTIGEIEKVIEKFAQKI